MAESIVGTNQPEIKCLVFKPGADKNGPKPREGCLAIPSQWGRGVPVPDTAQEPVLITLGQDPTKPHGQGEGREVHPVHALLRDGLNSWREWEPACCLPTLLQRKATDSSLFLRPERSSQAKLVPAALLEAWDL